MNPPSDLCDKAPVGAPETVAGGLKVPLKELTWHFVSRHVADILTVSEAEIIDAMRLI